MRKVQRDAFSATRLPTSERVEKESDLSLIMGGTTTSDQDPLPFVWSYWQMKRYIEQIPIRGIIIPVDWDQAGNVVKAAILTGDEGEYLIEENTGSQQLFYLLRREVEVRGVVREEAGSKIISVENFRETKSDRGWMVSESMNIKRKGGNKNGGSSSLS